MDLDDSTIVRGVAFRTPLSRERRLGLWIDRIGEARGPGVGPRLRTLGLHGIVHIVDGAGFFESASAGARKVGKGDLILLFPDEPHRYAPDGAWLQRWIVWDGPLAGVILDPDDSTVGDPIYHDGGSLFQPCFSDLARSMVRDDFASALERSAALQAMCAALSRRGRGRDPARDARRAVEEAADFARRFCERDIGPADLAARAGLSETHFRRLFRGLTGGGPVEFISAARVAKAKALLASGYSVKETAARVGYGDPAYFCRIFSRLEGRTPRDFSDREAGS